MIWLHFQVKRLRTAYKSLDIEVDGGVGPKTIDTAAEVKLSYTLLPRNNRKLHPGLQTGSYTLLVLTVLEIVIYFPLYFSSLKQS